MIVPNETNKHIIALCKKHFASGDTPQAIQRFIAKYCGVPEDKVYNSTVYEFLLGAMYAIVPREELGEFIKRIFRFSEYVTRESVIQQMVSTIATTSIRDVSGEILIDLSGLNPEYMEV